MAPSTTHSKHYNTITSQHVTLTQAESEHLSHLYSQFSKLTYYDQYAVLQKTISVIIEVYKSLNKRNYLPRLQYIQFLFDFMESHVNVFNLMLFTIRLLHVGPLIENYLRSKFVASDIPTGASSRIVYFEYLSHFYLNIVGVLRFHCVSLVMWKDLASEVFRRWLIHFIFIFDVKWKVVCVKLKKFEKKIKGKYLESIKTVFLSPKINFYQKM